MDKKKAIEILCNEMMCVRRQDTPDCNRDECGCQNCDLIQETEDVIEAYRIAIEALMKEVQPDTDERDCKNCIHNIEGGCSSWNCEFEKKPTEEDEAVEEARREAMKLDDNEDTLKWKGTH